MSEPHEEQTETSVEHPPEVAPAPEAVVVPWWQVHRRLYDWTLSLAHHRFASGWLFGLSFAESSFFPIPPDVLQMALTLERREKAWWYATVSTVASVLGGIAGYLIGLLAWNAVRPFFFDYVKGFTPENFEKLDEWYGQYAFVAILGAAFSPIPYKVFTVTAGVFGVPIWVLVVASALGRGGRFFLVAGIMWLFGPPAKRLIEKYFNLLTFVGLGLIVAGFIGYKLLSGDHGDSGGGADNGGVVEQVP